MVLEGGPSQRRSSVGTHLMGRWSLVPTALKDSTPENPKDWIELIQTASRDGVIEWQAVSGAEGSHKDQLAFAIEKDAPADSPLLVWPQKRSPMRFETKADALACLTACDLAKSMEWKDVLKAKFGDKPIDIKETR